MNLLSRRSFVASILALAIAPVALAKFDFGPWPAGASPQEVGKRVADNFAARPHGNVNARQPVRMIIYPETCAWYGALTFARLTHDTTLTQQLIARFDPLFGPEAKLIPAPVHVDNTVFGTVPFELYIQTKDKRYLDIGLTLADTQWAKPTPEQLPSNAELRATGDEAVKSGLTWQTRFWIDDMYMITMVQTQAFRATGEPKYLDRAAREAVAYLDKLQQPNGLFYHAPDVPYFWGRGDGWFAAGMSELLQSLPANHPDRARIMAGYKKMMASLLKYQDADGMWHQLIDHPEDPKDWPETSCTGMFTYAFISGVKNGWLDAQAYGPAARKGWLALQKYLEPNGDIREVCEGTNKKNDYQYYLDRKRVTGDLHGEAPVLWCATALLR
jgi:unsaturated rhamnogalacturonyl hydrolase